VRILVAEDERKLAQVLASALKAGHYHVVLASTWAVEVHEGRITVDERPGGGSEFLIRLPLAGPSPAPQDSGR
jgi:hypothetical protein